MSFNDDREFTQRARELLEQQLYPRLAYNGRFVAVDGSAGSRWIQSNAHIDCVVQTGPGVSITVEEKIVRKLYNAFAVETEGDLQRSQQAGEPDGWIHTSTADVLVYAFTVPAGLDAYYFRMAALRRWFMQNSDRYLTVERSNGFGDHLARCVLVPVRDTESLWTKYELRRYPH